MTVYTGSHSMLFQPLKIADGKITLKHRVVLAPLTRNRGKPLNPHGTTQNPNRLWYPDDLMVEYYRQRTTDGGLLISEGIPPSLESNGMPGVPGIFIEEQAFGWKKVVDAVHEKGGFIYCQLWNAGRATIPQMTGSPAICPSASVWDDPTEYYAYPPVGSSGRVRYADYPPITLSVSHINKTIQDYCNAAQRAMEIGFDGVELHAGNGYLPEQFLSSNINKRTDDYGGTPEKRCKFVLELMDELAKVVGEENLSIRLSPFGLFNQNRSEQRMETWHFLCQRLKGAHPKLSYVSFIEPCYLRFPLYDTNLSSQDLTRFLPLHQRFEQTFTIPEKDAFLKSWGLAAVDLSTFRALFGSTPFFSAGGWNDTNSWGVIESGKYDAFLYGRYFISNPDLVERLRTGRELTAYDRSSFYGPFEDNSRGYTDYLTLEEEDAIRGT
ncbi:hypothetical protein EPUS_03407 [Endocarpon pusillum Z07020]|uniref:NADH:flavin oxidoreductase/NADH oxidase N-terminal domain-containing protein n=1 Tax=Endocarpon pusillum (strain Z07020 / HMAS-L-300199) TaxID=1263415 RepID=U1G9Q5_ENDPU|nr:uncharacterized protein EPUS_03407 [Endocarpon pusillum Z07020]ERF74217.1 hypothetical protein EPUS_03407 [Endocarpon pusillum Z07020]